MNIDLIRKGLVALLYASMHLIVFIMIAWFYSILLGYFATGGYIVTISSSYFKQSIVMPLSWFYLIIYGSFLVIGTALLCISAYFVVEFWTKKAKIEQTLLFKNFTAKKVKTK